MSTTLTYNNRQSLKKVLPVVALATAMLLVIGFAYLSVVRNAEAARPSDFGLTEGNTISADGSPSDPSYDPDIYIVNDAGYKRLFLNPAIFSFYGHLGGFSNVRKVSPAVRDAFPTSGLFRNCETNDPKVYGVEITGEDVGTLHWVNTTGAQAVADDPNFFLKVFCINNNEFAFYPMGANYTSVNQIPQYNRVTPTATPIGYSPTPTPTVVTGIVTVSANSNTGGSIISGAAQVPVLNFRVSNGTNGDVWVTGARFTKTGVISDSNIANAYISLGNEIVAQYTGLTGGVISFTGNLFKVAANTSVDVTLRVDISSGTSNGNTIGFNIQQASDITLSGGTLNGSFPIVGGMYTSTTVSNPSLATIGTPTYQTVASTVDAGATGFRAAAISVNITNSPVKMLSARFNVSGSLNAGDLANLKLTIDGTQVGTATSMVDSKVFFDMSANPPVMNTGSHQIEVYSDVLGTPNRTFKFEILRPFDWVFVDTQYNTNISGGTPSGTATTVTVRAGTITATLDSATPTGNIPRGGSSVTIAKFAVRASGEPVKIKWLPFKLTETGSVASWATATNVDADVRNISIIADDGAQLGTTINTPSSCTYGTPEVTATTYICSFGSPSSNINYIVPANTTRIFSLRVDVQSAGDITTLKGSLLAPSGTVGFTGSNTEGQISFQTSSMPGGTIDGSILTIAASPFQGSQNTSFSTQTYVGGTNVARISSFSLSASSAEAIRLTNVTLNTSADVNAASPLGLQLQNLMVKVTPVGAVMNGAWNYTIPTISGNTSYTFSSPGAPLMIAAGGTVVVDVYADILTNSSTSNQGYIAPIKLEGAVGSGANTNTNQTLKDSAGVTVSSSNRIAGQNIKISGAGAVTATFDNSTPPAQQIVLGSTNVPLAKIRFQANNNEDIQIQDLTFVASASLPTGVACSQAANSGSGNCPSTFNNLRLYDDSGTLVGTGNSLVASVTYGLYRSSFHFASPLIVTKNASRNYTLKADVSTFTQSQFSHNVNYNFKVTNASNVNAFGLSSNQAAVVGGVFPLVANTQTTLKTKLTAALAPSVSGIQSRKAVDDIGILSLTVPSGDFGAEFASVSFTLSGAVFPAPGSTIQLVDFDTNVTVASASTNGASGTTYKLNVGVTSTGGTPAPFLVSAGTTKKYKVRVNSSTYANPGTSTETLSVQIANASSLRWQSQGAGTTGGYTNEVLGLQGTDVPISFTVSYE